MCSPLCSSSLIPPIAFVALLEFEREGLEHLCGVLVIAFGASFEFSTVIRGGESKKVVTLGFLEP